VVTYEHSLSISISKKAYGYKLTYYEPDVEGNKIYWTTVIPLEEGSYNRAIVNILLNMGYFQSRVTEIVQVLLKCYTREKLKPEITLQKDIKLPNTDEEVQQLLIISIETAGLGLLQYLLENSNTPINFYCTNHTLLTMAIVKGLYDAVSLLLQHGADPHLREQTHGFSPLEIAECKKSNDIKSLLLKYLERE
jgi:hypothetical protein